MSPSLLLALGVRKYINADERVAFSEHIRPMENLAGLFCWVLLESGCRPSEALALKRRNIDVGERVIVFESLKKRRRGVYRAVPVSNELIGRLDRHFAIAAGDDSREERLWPWSRATAYRRVCARMAAVGIQGPHACPKGLRHGFGVAAVSAGIPLNVVQRWLGHADMKTTAIYANALGAEERWLASWTWLPPPAKDASVVTCRHRRAAFTTLPSRRTTGSANANCDACAHERPQAATSRPKRRRDRCETPLALIPCR